MLTSVFTFIAREIRRLRLLYCVHLFFKIFTANRSTLKLSQRLCQMKNKITPSLVQAPSSEWYNSIHCSGSSRKAILTFFLILKKCIKRKSRVESSPFRCSGWTFPVVNDTIHCASSSSEGIFTRTLVGSLSTCVGAAQLDKFCIVCSAVYPNEFFTL